MNNRRILSKAFTASLPVLMGYTAMGMAAGILLAGTIRRDDIMLWAFFSSMTSISGALQFAMADWFGNRTALIDVALLTLFLNIRYAMYGLSLLEKFKGISWWKKCYLIWSLTDETFALEAESNFPDKKQNTLYCITVAMLNHSYWVFGVTLGAAAGKILPFSTRGIDFAMTALFLVVLTDQCREQRNRIPAVIGAISAIAGRIFFSVENMLIPAMVMMTVIFIAGRKHLETTVRKAGDK
ncbi:MAG: branched-chain amino acid ABC transporter permease [Lentisphaerae bacterium]|nr:branched-chain amino acid ABC transporter permease [Lentisphaerota bacterium]